MSQISAAATDDFSLFGLPQRFAQDEAAIDAVWCRLQAAAHPDRAASDAQAQRIAVQASARINQAHRRLKDPLARAAYLCELAGVPVDGTSQQPLDPAFLVQQMNWREALDDAGDAASVERLAQEVQVAERAALDTLAHLFDNENDPKRASDQIRMLMFLKRLLSAVEQRLDQLESAGSAARS